MTHFNYYKEKLDNFEETINQMHSPLEADDLTKIKCIKRKLLCFKTKIVNSNFCANIVAQLSRQKSKIFIMN